MGEKKVLRICVPKNGKPYLREKCANSDKAVDTLEIEAADFKLLQAKLNRMEKQVRHLTKAAVGRRQPVKKYPSNLTPTFVAPDGKIYPIKKPEWDKFEHERVYGKT